MLARVSAKAKLRLSVALAAVMFMLALGVLVLALERQDQSRRDICVAVNNLNRAITESLERGEKNLPRLQYYREHPRELEQQRAEIRRELRVFAPRTCG